MASSPPYSQNYMPQHPKRPGDISQSLNSKRRKQSSMSMTSSSSAHPLRQTSFPPDEVMGDSRGYSPSGRSPSMENASLVSGSLQPGKTGKKRGRKPKNAVADDGGSLIGKGSAAVSLMSGRGGKQQEEEEEDDDAEGNMDVAHTTHTEEDKRRDKYHRSLLVEEFDPDQYLRYETYRSSKLSDSTTRRLVNQTLSQSVPGNVVMATKATSKVFVGQIIERARVVQTQWLHASVEDPARESPPGANRTPKDDEDDEKRCRYTKAEIAQWEKNQDESRRPPLLGGHLIEAYRRIKEESSELQAGLGNLSRTQHPTGLETFGPKFGGKRKLR